MPAGTVCAVETFPAVLKVVFFRNGNRLGAGVAIAALGALVLEHVWLLH